MDKPVEVGLIKETTIENFDINSSSHTLMFDLKFLRRRAIGDAIKKFVEVHPTKNREAYDNLVGMAIGYYQVELDAFYPEVKDIYELNDSTLASVVRWAEIRRKEEELAGVKEGSTRGS